MLPSPKLACDVSTWTKLLSILYNRIWLSRLILQETKEGFRICFSMTYSMGKLCTLCTSQKLDILFQSWSPSLNETFGNTEFIGILSPDIHIAYPKRNLISLRMYPPISNIHSNFHQLVPTGVF